MKLLGKLAFCLATAGTIAPAFAFDPPPPPHHDDRDHHDDRYRHDDHYADHHDDHRGPSHHWERGHRYEGPTVVVNDWRSRRLREPPRGYHWVRDDNSGEFLLVAVATGVITDIILQNQ